MNNLPNDTVWIILSFLHPKQIFSLISLTEGFFSVIRNENFCRELSEKYYVPVMKVLEQFVTKEKKKSKPKDSEKEKIVSKGTRKCSCLDGFISHYKLIIEILRFQNKYYQKLKAKKKKKKKKKKKDHEFSSSGKEDALSDPVKILVVGSSGTGCTSIIDRYVKNTFEDSVEYIPMIEDTASKDVNFEGQELELWIADLPGYEEYYHPMQDGVFRENQNFVVVCSIESKDSLREVSDRLAQISHVKCQNCEFSDIPVVIAVNKIDLDAKDWEVSKMEALAMIYKEYQKHDEIISLAHFQASRIFFVSAKTHISITELFEGLLKIVKNDLRQLIIWLRIEENLKVFLKRTLSDSEGKTKKCVVL